MSTVGGMLHHFSLRPRIYVSRISETPTPVAGHAEESELTLTTIGALGALHGHFVKKIN